MSNNSFLLWRHSNGKTQNVEDGSLHEVEFIKPFAWQPVLSEDLFLTATKPDRLQSLVQQLKYLEIQVGGNKGATVLKVKIVDIVERLRF